MSDSSKQEKATELGKWAEGLSEILDSDNPSKAIQWLKEGFELAGEAGKEVPFPKAIARNIGTTYLMMSDSTLPAKPPNETPGSADFGKWLIGRGLNTLVMPAKYTYATFAEFAKTYLGDK